MPRQKLWQMVAEAIKQAIDSGEFKPGHRMTANYVAGRWHVSRDTAYDALRMLRQLGYTYGVRGSGTYVTNPKDYMIEEVEEL